MKIGIDAALVGQNRSGNERFTRGLVRGLGVSMSGTSDSLALCGPNLNALRSIDTGGAHAEYVVTPPGVLGDLAWGRRVSRAGADVVIASYNAPLGCRGRVATVVHDVSFRRVPEMFPVGLRFRIEASVRRSIRTSDLIVTVSEFSRSELMALYPQLSSDRIAVVPNGVDYRYFRENITDEAVGVVRARYGLNWPFVLAVGNLQPRKNIHRLIAATKAAGVRLVVAGQSLWRGRRLEEDLRQAATWLGFVPESDLPALYAACDVFAYPSLYEGFGLPIVEAMAAGAPVVTGNRTGTAEACGDAGLKVNPESVEEIAEALDSLMRDRALRSRLTQLGELRARRFTWERSGATMHEAVVELVGSHATP